MRPKQRTILFLFAWITAALFFPALSRTDDIPLQVLQKTPFGETNSTEHMEITATFSEPMVPLSSNEEMGSFCPLKITPALAGRCRWRGTNTLVFEPSEPLKNDHHYHVVIPAGTASKVSGHKLSQETSWDFNTLRPQIQFSWPNAGLRWVALDSVPLVRFTLDVSPQEIKPFIKLMAAEINQPQAESTEEPSLGNSASFLHRAKKMLSLSPTSGASIPEDAVPLDFSIRPPTPDELKKTYGGSGDNIVAIVPNHPLKKDHAYYLVLQKGLPSKGGEVGLPDDRVIPFETWYTFRFMGQYGDIACLGSGGHPGFSLSNPVDAKELTKNISINPPIKLNMPNNYPWGREDYGERSVHFDLDEAEIETNQTYTLTIQGDLTDVFGNKLGKTESFSFKVGPYCPKIRMPDGFGLIESYLDRRHPVDFVNVPQASLNMAVISRDEIVPLLAHWYQNGWSTNTTVTENQPFSFEGIWTPHYYKENTRLHSYVDLGKVLPKNKGGFVLSQLFTQAQALTEAPANETFVSSGGRKMYRHHKAVPQRVYTGTDRNFIALDDVTPLGLTFKSSPDSILIWSSRLRTAAGAPKVPLEIRDSENKVLWKGVTDKDGFAEAPGWRGLGITEWPEYQRPQLWLLAEDPQGDAVLSSDMRGGIEPWRFSIYNDSTNDDSRLRGFLFTDRGVYRPGEKVYLKGIFRKLGVNDWEDLPPTDWVVSLTNSRGEDVYGDTLTARADSSLDLSYTVPPNSPTGNWRFRVQELSNKRTQFSEGFRVEDIKPAAFEVKAHPLQESFLAGDNYQSTLEGWYLFGAPMAGAQADWQLLLNPTEYRPPNCEGYDFTPGWWENRQYTGHEAASGSVTLDSKGSAILSAQLDPDKLTGPFSADLEASVTSPDRQKIFARSSVIVHRSNLYIGIKSMGYFVEKGKSWRADILCVRPDGTKVRNVSMKAVLKRRQWMSVQKSGIGGRLEWVSEMKDTVVKETNLNSPSGPYPFSFSPTAAGDYFLAVSAKDEKGRPVETAVEFMVGGTGDAYWQERDDDIVELVPDKKEYKPGETAHILVKSPYPHSKVMVSIERETVLDHWTTELRGGADFIDVPLTEKSLPNVFVGVMLVQGRMEKAKFSPKGDDLAKPQAKFGYVNLPVNPKGRRLKVEVATDKAEYRPDQPVTVTVSTTDESGAPARSEVTLFAVDEGLLMLTGYKTPDVFNAFYGPRGLMVSTADSRLFVIGERNFGEKGEARGGGGGRSALAGVDLRSQFVPTAYWNPSVRTDADGKAVLRFKLPDNLSRFRVMAVAQSEKRFGSGETSFKVNKFLLLRPSLPRFSRLHDHFQGGVVIHNNSAKTMQITLQLKSETSVLKIDEAPEKQLIVPSGGATEVLWDMTAIQLGKALLAFRAASADSVPETDGLEWSLPVEEPEHLETVATSAALSDKAEEAFQLPPYAGKDSGELKVTLSSSALAGLKQGAAFLLDYPYGCLEQKLSRSFPVITGADLLETFGLGKMEDLKKSVQDAMNGLPDYQNEDGGFRYWSSWEPSDPYLTAYALEVSAYAKKENYLLPETCITRARGFLNRYLGSQQQWAFPYSESEDYASRAYALYALSLWGDQPTNYFNQLYQKRDQIPFLAKTYLLKAAPRLLNDPQVTETLAQEILNQAKISPTSIHFEEPSETRMPWIHASTVNTTAQCLQALLDAKGGFPGDEKVIAWMTEERKTKGRWETTLDNARALQAFQDFYRRYEKELPDFTFKVQIQKNGTYAQWWSDLFKGRSLSTKNNSMPLSELFADGPDNRIQIEKNGPGRLYYSLRMDYLPTSYAQPVSEGFLVEKTIQTIDGGDLKELKAGQRAVVTLKVSTSQDRLFVAVNDPLPGGFEIVDPSFAVEGKQGIATGGSNGSFFRKKHIHRFLSVNPDNDWGAYWGSFNHHENYDDRIQIFSDFMSAGTHSYSYLIQATTPGVFGIPSTWAEEMYEPEVFGRTATGSVTIEK